MAIPVSRRIPPVMASWPRFSSWRRSGMSQLVLSNVFLNLSAQGFDIENGHITVTGLMPSAVPEPATLVLMTSGLALLARYRMR